MSVKATNFVRGFRGLSPSEKAVAFVLADHDKYPSGGAWPSMATVATEAGLRNRSTASRITKRLIEHNVIWTTKQSKGRTPTRYFFNYNSSDRDCRDTVEKGRTVIAGSRLSHPDRDSATHTTVTEELFNHGSQGTARVSEGLKGGASLMKFPQDQESPKLQVPVSTRFQVTEATDETAVRTGVRTIVGNTPEDLDHRLRFLRRQGDEIQKKYHQAG